MRPTEILTNEHRVIEVVLDCLDVMAERCRGEGRLDGEAAGKAIDFFRSFADRCHHAKEENELFPMMEARGVSPHQGPTAVMRAEHVQGRELIAAMERAVPAAAAGEDAGRTQWIEAATRYSMMLRDHIQKEDHCLFPMADQHLPAPEMEELGRRFERVERADIGPGVHERYVRLAETLAERFGVDKAGLTAAGSCGCSGH